MMDTTRLNPILALAACAFAQESIKYITSQGTLPRYQLRPESAGPKWLTVN